MEMGCSMGCSGTFVVLVTYRLLPKEDEFYRDSRKTLGVLIHALTVPSAILFGE